MRCAGLALVLMLAAFCTTALGAERLPERACLTATQAREKIALHNLTEPFQLMMAMARRFQAEALRVKLCRRKDEFIYEISLLRRDGRVIHVFLKASNGQFIRATNTK